MSNGRKMQVAGMVATFAALAGTSFDRRPAWLNTNASDGKPANPAKKAKRKAARKARRKNRK